MGQDTAFRPNPLVELPLPTPNDAEWTCKHRGSCNWAYRDIKIHRRYADQYFAGRDKCVRCRTLNVECQGTGCFSCVQCRAARATCSHSSGPKSATGRSRDGELNRPTRRPAQGGKELKKKQPVSGGIRKSTRARQPRYKNQDVPSDHEDNRLPRQAKTKAKEGIAETYQYAMIPIPSPPQVEYHTPAQPPEVSKPPSALA